MKGKVRYQRELQKTYMIVTECDNTLLENYAGRMALQGKLRGLITCRKHFIDGEWEVWYDISSLQTLEQVFAVKEITFSELKNFIQQLLIILEELEKCLMDSRQLCFDPQWLYLDMKNEQIKFLFDYTEKREENGINRLGEYLLERTNHEDESAVNLVYFFYDQIQKENFSVKDIEIYLNEKIMEPSKEITKPFKEREETPKQIAEFSEQITELPRVVKEPKKEKTWYQINWNSKEGMLLEGGLVFMILVVFLGIGYFIAQKYFFLTKMETLLWIGVSVLLFGVGIGLAAIGFIKERNIEKTQKLSALQEVDIEEDRDFYCDLLEKQISDETDGRTIYVGNALLNREYSLVEKRKGEELTHAVFSYPFLIGKERDRVNLMVKDHSVSRIHARLIEEDGMVYIEDLHSTNGTYVNDLLLTPHERVKLKRGDFLQFGKVEFDFR